MHIELPWILLCVCKKDFPGWWPSIELSANRLKLLISDLISTQWEMIPDFRCRYKSLQSRFITENILQFNSIKTISISDSFMLPVHSYHLARYICFNWCSVTVQWSWNGNNTQSQFILHFICALTMAKDMARKQQHRRAKHNEEKITATTTQHHTHRHRHIMWVELHEMRQQIQVLMPVAQRLLVKPVRSWFWEITFVHFKFGNDFSAL